MKSHLTRRVFRSILANEPIVHSGCLRRRALSTARIPSDNRPSTTRHHGSSLSNPPQRRTFFNLGMFGGKKQSVREADIDPGLDVMEDLERMKRMRARLPPPEDVADALHRFFEAKDKKNRPQAKQGFNERQCQLVYDSMKYCLESGEGTEAHRMMLDKTMLVRASQTICKAAPNCARIHAQLAELLLGISPKQPLLSPFRCLVTYVTALTCCGETTKARDYIRYLDFTSDKATHLPIEAHDTSQQPAIILAGKMRTERLCEIIVGGFTRENNEEAALQTVEMLEAKGMVIRRGISGALIDYYMTRTDAEAVAAVERWFWHYWRLVTGTNDDDTYVQLAAAKLNHVLSWCRRAKQLELGRSIVRAAMADNPPKLFWDAILIWAAGTGKGPDEIDRMLSVMEASNDKVPDRDRWRIPDNTTINGLVEFAVAENDPYLAERFITIGKQRNIQPDARTYVLQMQYRLKVKDVDGALVAYTSLQSMDTSDDSDISTVNELIVALCQSRRHDFDTIMNVAADLSDRRARFEPNTVIALALLHFNRDEVLDVTDLLNTHVFHYSSEDKALIRNAIVNYCLKPQTPTSRAWDGYTILSKLFDEMPGSQRTQIMLSFFDRERADIATHIFTEMRRHSRPDTMPTVDTYVAAFLACAKLRDIDVMEVIHNQLKLDYNIDPTTYLRNALIIGYTAGGKPRRGLEFWDDIVASKEGPTYNSIHIALRACEKAPFGDLKAQEIWKRLRRTRVELDQSMWASYVGALVGNGDMELGISTVEEAESKGELEVDAYLVGSMLNGAPGQSKQDEVEHWAKERHPEVWAELERIGIESDEADMRTAKIDRTVTP